MDSYFKNISIGIAALSVAYYFINQSGVGTYQISAPLQLNTKTGELYILSGGVSKKKIMDATFGKPASSLQDALNSKDTASKAVDWSQYSEIKPTSQLDDALSEINEAVEVSSNPIKQSSKAVDWSKYSHTPPKLNSEVDWSKYSHTKPSSKVVQTVSKQSNEKSGSIDLSETKNEEGK